MKQQKTVRLSHVQLRYCIFPGLREGQLISYLLTLNLLILFVRVGAAQPCDSPVIPIEGLFNTGVDSSGIVLPPGSTELHYVVTGEADSAIVATPNGRWVDAPIGSAWIGPSAGDVSDPVGEYLYTLPLG